MSDVSLDHSLTIAMKPDRFRFELILPSIYAKFVSIFVILCGGWGIIYFVQEKYDKKQAYPLMGKIFVVFIH